ncbi:hypothetical protein B0J13DRAFT_608390 [Dactylonectria estremocensis]|uniref:Uncharacterized protein n=1 Tax=Dactylonectria estremocensis TaxID=1079267 RepID=A0A9P9ENL5_9HYPO|nr:hypothetical protein B0J13DRAFT_608390 [Dactylonectria estremocensis]
MASTTPASSSKRKHNDSIPVQIVKDVKRLCTRELSPETEILREDLLEEATRAINDANIDQSGLQRQLTMLNKLLDSRDKAEELKGKLEDVRGKLEEVSARTRDSDYSIHIGDWVGGIYGAVKCYEGQVQADIRKVLEKQFKSDGMTGVDADFAAKVHDNFLAVKGYDCRSSVDLLQPELRLVREWRERGEPVGDEPATPYLDRIGAMCDKANGSRPDYILAARAYSERNQIAHYPPPRFEDHWVDGSVHWDGIWAACKKHKIDVKNDCATGKITENQRDYYFKIIDIWMDSQVSVGRRIQKEDEQEAKVEGSGSRNSSDDGRPGGSNCPSGSTSKPIHKGQRGSIPGGESAGRRSRTLQPPRGAAWEPGLKCGQSQCRDAAKTRSSFYEAPPICRSEIPRLPCLHHALVGRLTTRPCMLIS